MQQDPSQNPQSAEAQNWHPPMAEVQAVDPTQAVEVQAQTLEQQLGLPDQFIVRRGDETEADIADTGWKVDGFKDIVDPRDATGNTVIRAVKISKTVTEPNGDTTELTKARLLETLLSWQHEAGSAEAKESDDAENGLETVGAPAVHAEVVVEDVEENTADDAITLPRNEVVEARAAVDSAREDSEVPEASIEAAQSSAEESNVAVAVEASVEDPVLSAEFKQKAGQELGHLFQDLNSTDHMSVGEAASAAQTMFSRAESLPTDLRRVLEGAAIASSKELQTTGNLAGRLNAELTKILPEGDRKAKEYINNFINGYMQDLAYAPQAGSPEEFLASKRAGLAEAFSNQSKAVERYVTSGNEQTKRELTLLMHGLALGMASSSNERAYYMTKLERTLLKK